MTSSGYSVPCSAEEVQRLDLQAQYLEAPTRRALDHAGLSLGMSCLDVGCGTGRVMRLMGQRVGNAGRVTGLDPNGPLGRASVEQMVQESPLPYEFVEGNVDTVDFAERRFDVVFSRLLILHLADPSASLRRMWEWTRPGGVLVAMEFDFRTIDAYPCVDAVEILKRTMFRTLDHLELDRASGSRLPSFFQRAGVGSPDGVEPTVTCESIRAASPLIDATYESYSRHGLRAGLATDDEVRAFATSLAAASEVSPEPYFVSPMLVTAWKRKPTD